MNNETDLDDINSTIIIEDEWYKRDLVYIYKIQLYYTPILCIFGSVGNALSVFVFFSTKLRKLSSSYYLSALAISDTGVLIPIFMAWLELIDIHLFNISIICQTSVYLTHMCSFLSVWFVVSFTVERFIAVRYPLRRPSVCTVARARCVLASLTMISVILHSPYLLMPDVIQGRERDPSSNETKLVCDLPDKWKSWASKLNHLDLFLTLVIPFSMIVILNTLISRTVCRLARVRRSMTHKHSGCSSRHHHRNRANSSQMSATTTASSSSSSSSQTKVTEMLLIVSTVFICLNLPSYVFRGRLYMDKSIQENEKRLLVILQHMANILYNTNFGINFALYCVSGQNFRRALTSLFCPRIRRRRAETTTVTVMSEYTRSIMHHGGNNNTNSSIMNRRKTITINGNGGGSESTNLTATRNDATSGRVDDSWNETNNC